MLASPRRQSPALPGRAVPGAALRGTEASRPGACPCFGLALPGLGIAGRRVKGGEPGAARRWFVQGRSVLCFNVLAVLCLTRRLRED